MLWFIFTVMMDLIKVTDMKKSKRYHCLFSGTECMSYLPVLITHSQRLGCGDA